MSFFFFLTLILCMYVPCYIVYWAPFSWCFLLIKTGMLWSAKKTGRSLVQISLQGLCHGMTCLRSMPPYSIGYVHSLVFIWTLSIDQQFPFTECSMYNSTAANVKWCNKICKTGELATILLHQEGCHIITVRKRFLWLLRMLIIIHASSNKNT